MRYAQLISIVNQSKPNVVVEIGTWNGNRAIEMNRVNEGMSYIGFDLFEDASTATDVKEKNVKKHFFKYIVEKKLAAAGMDFTLIHGDTNETFTEWADEHRNSVDLVYIDGGHSVETITNDYNNALKVLKKDGIIVFDDYYEDMPESEIDKYGANRVLENSSNHYELLSMRDPVAGGGFVRMAVMLP